MAGVIDLDSAGGGAHTYTYVYQAGSSCERRDSVTITINDPGLDLNAGMNVPLCEGSIGTYIFNTPSPPGGTWSGYELQDALQGTVNVSNLQLDTIYKYAYCIADQAVAGCSACDTVELIVYSLPDASFQVAGSTCIDEIFTASVSVCDASNTYTWDFDTGSGIGCSPSHVYTSPGNYSVTLNVVSEFGCIDSAELVVHVTTPPIAQFAVDQVEGCAPLVVNVTSNTSTGDSLQYQWYVGDDIFTDSIPGPFVFDGISQDSVFMITLETSNQCASDKDSVSILVHPYPDAFFGFNVDNGCTPLLIEFGDTTRGNPETWYWDLGDMTFSTDSVPAPHYYTTPPDSVSMYIVELTVSNMCGSDSHLDTITVYPPDVAAFISMNDTI
jgi:PKD repeat protein